MSRTTRTSLNPLAISFCSAAKGETSESALGFLLSHFGGQSLGTQVVMRLSVEKSSFASICVMTSLIPPASDWHAPRPAPVPPG